MYYVSVDSTRNFFLSIQKHSFKSPSNLIKSIFLAKKRKLRWRTRFSRALVLFSNDKKPVPFTGCSRQLRLHVTEVWQAFELLQANTNQRHVEGGELKQTIESFIFFYLYFTTPMKNKNSRNVVRCKCLFLWLVKSNYSSICEHKNEVILSVCASFATTIQN